MGEVRNTFHNAVLQPPDPNDRDFGPGGPYNGTVPPTEGDFSLRRTFDNGIVTPPSAGTETPGEVIRTSLNRVDVPDAPAKGGSVDFMNVPGSGTKAGGFR